jgi:anti-sigma factor RsiW
MNSSSPTDTEHREVWNLLPWFVTGRLSDADRGRVEAHLQNCSECRDEYAVQRGVHAVVATDAAVEQIPTAGLNKLRRRIDDNETHRSPLMRPMVRRSSDRRRASRLRAGAIAASIFIVALSIGIPTARLWQNAAGPGDSPSYYTVTSNAPQPPTAVIRAVFAPHVTLSALQSLLVETHLRIVSGPTEAGVYSLAMSGTQSMEWSLERLRAREEVRFAEPLSQSPTPPAASAAAP